MSLLEMLPNYLKASKEEIKKRYDICHDCEFRVKSTGSCGRLIIGSKVIYNGEEKKLCGCITDEKGVLKSEHCDLSKW